MSDNNIKRLFLVAAIVVAALIAKQAKAETTVVLHGLSKHFVKNSSENREYHESHLGAGVNYKFNNTFSGQISYVDHNSYGRHSWYGMGEITVLRTKYVNLGGFGVVSHNYPENERKVTFGGAGFIRAEVGRFTATVRIAPTVSKTRCGFATLELGVKL